jgi:hypothetical protein
MPKACGKLCAYGARIDETVNGISGSLPPAGPPSSNWEFTTKSRPRTSAPVVENARRGRRRDASRE